MVFSYEGDKAFSKTDKTYAERALIDYRFDSVVGTEFVSPIPKRTHDKRELLGKSCFLEIETFVKLLSGDVKDFIKLFEETFDSFQ